MTSPRNILVYDLQIFIEKGDIFPNNLHLGKFFSKATKHDPPCSHATILSPHSLLHQYHTPPQVRSYSLSSN